LDRDTLIQQVKHEYARLADIASRGHIEGQPYSGVPLEAYYEQALEKAIRDISFGKYDNCLSGLEVVEHIANHKTKSQRIQDTIENTLHNMEIAEETIATETGNKNIQALKEENERRIEAIPQMIREMKQEQAREEIKVDSPNIIGVQNDNIHRR
jgi:small acid-soluble spore protein tlp